MNKRLITLTLVTFTVLQFGLSHAQDVPPPGKKVVKYSPFPEQNYPNNVFFGDTHLHTSIQERAYTSPIWYTPR